jgi:hypothetical protein
MTLRSYGELFYLSALALSNCSLTVYLTELAPVVLATFRQLVSVGGLLLFILDSGAGGGNRTHGLGIMRPSLYH